MKENRSDWRRYITFPANVVPRGKKDGFQAQHQLAQEAGVRVLEDLHALQRVQMHVYGNFRLQFVGEEDQGLFFVRRFVTVPEIVEPLDDAVL